MIWSSDCMTAVWRMINQTDWMGQIRYVIAQSGRGSEEEKWVTLLYVCMSGCVR